MKVIKNIGILFLFSMFGSAVFAQNRAQELKPYRNSVTSKGFVFLSGQLGTKVPSAENISFNAEVHQAITNVSKILAESNLDLQDAVSVTVYLKDREQFATFNAIYLQYFKKPFPARTCVIVKDLLQNANIEITVIASGK